MIRDCPEQVNVRTAAQVERATAARSDPVGGSARARDQVQVASWGWEGVRDRAEVLGRVGVLGAVEPSQWGGGLEPVAVPGRVAASAPADGLGAVAIQEPAIQERAEVSGTLGDLGTVATRESAEPWAWAGRLVWMPGFQVSTCHRLGLMRPTD